MSHRSRLGTLVIDCEGEDLAAAVRFWSEALGFPVRVDPDNPRYARIETPAGQPHMLVQAVEHPSRVHLDIETDDREAERVRLQALGAVLVERHPQGWTVMQAPTGQRFCLTGPNREDFPGDAKEHA